MNIGLYFLLNSITEGKMLYPFTWRGPQIGLFLGKEIKRFGQNFKAFSYGNASHSTLTPLCYICSL